MVVMVRALLIIAVFFLPSASAFAAQKKSVASQDTLKQYIEDLKKTPEDKALREKIILFTQTMKPAPVVPEEAERNMARGTAFANKAKDMAGYKRAVAEFEAATNTAPWLALAYYNLGVMQEKEGLYAEALQNLKFYLLADPEAKNARDVKNKIYELEADAEDLQASKSASAPAGPAPSSAPTAASAGKSPAIISRPPLGIEPEKQLSIIKMPSSDKKSRLSNFIGNWYFKETMRGEELTIQAFEIAKNANGDLVATPPKRSADSHANIPIFEINDRKLKVQMKWKMKSVVGYWKTETYELTLSEDGKTLSGSHNQKSVGGRNIDMDRVLFRQ